MLPKKGETMRKYIVLVVALIFMMMLSTGANSDQFTVTGFNINDSGQVNYKEVWETATTSDTVTAAESGKTFLVDINTGNVTFTLPTAATGLNYRFVAVDGNAKSGQGRIYIDPQSTDKFVGCVNSSTVTTFSNGDKLYSPSATGDSVRIIATSANEWVCTDRVGTWVDGN